MRFTRPAGLSVGNRPRRPLPAADEIDCHHHTDGIGANGPDSGRIDWPHGCSVEVRVRDGQRYRLRRFATTAERSAAAD